MSDESAHNAPPAQPAKTTLFAGGTTPMSDESAARRFHPNKKQKRSVTSNFQVQPVDSSPHSGQNSAAMPKRGWSPWRV
jgi:hypothetical protein